MTELAYQHASKVAAEPETELDLQLAGRGLDQAVAANPRDLASHVQRIHFHWHRHRAESLFGALVDLFLVLEQNGLALRSRLLRNCEKVLDSRQQVFLLQHLDSGLDESTPLPPNTASVFGGSSADPIAEQNGRRADRETVAFQLAEEYIRLGWDDLGKTLLKEILDEEPGNKAARLALVKLP
jgi:hypothetical protein